MKTTVREKFASEFATAKLWLRQDAEIIDTECQLFGLASDVWSAIMFPHLLIYALLKEHLYNEDDVNLYIIGGSETADVESGPYHIKPSTAEVVEADWVHFQREHNSPIVLFEEYYENETEARKARVLRLHQKIWQIRYACMYLYLMKHRFTDFMPKDFEEEIKFYSAGFSLAPRPDKERILNGMDGVWFPFGPGNKGNEHSYAEVSLEYYRDLERGR